jgi:nitrite reductase/ring-hydroxylating ferredoxin subunit
MQRDSRITSADRISRESTFVFTVRETESGDEREAILVRTEDELVGWLNYCQHFTHIKLDKGSGAPMRDGEIVCANHGAYFDSASGRCTFGPCEGAFLNEVDVAVEDGDVYLTDADYEFVAPEAMASDDADLSSKSNYEF